MKKHSFYLFLILVTSWQWSMAQDVSRFKILDDSACQSNNEYQSCNKYQKDAILFMDMVADMHPYYIKADRRAEWFTQKWRCLSSARASNRTRTLSMPSTQS